MSEKIGFVGVGRMGANMARRLKECGHTISAVFDARPEVAAELAKELGSHASANLAEVTKLSSIIITVVNDDKSMKEIFSKGLLKRAKGRTFINCATVTPDTHRWVEEKATKKGAFTLEACMASSINQARSGSLYLMCGGLQETFDRVKPVLDQLSDEGKLLRYIGTSGKAAEVKALVNMVMNINTAGLAEGLGLGHALGLDLKVLMEVFSQTGANSRVLVTDGEDMLNRDHSCFFSAEHAAKDSGIALKLGKQQAIKLPLASATFKQYESMKEAGLGHLDKSGIAELTFKGRHLHK